MRNTEVIDGIKQYFSIRKDRRWRAGFLQAARFFNEITQKQWRKLTYIYVTKKLK